MHPACCASLSVMLLASNLGAPAAAQQIAGRGAGVVTFHGYDDCIRL
jgi:hypothetical protein